VLGLSFRHEHATLATAPRRRHKDVAGTHPFLREHSHSWRSNGAQRYTEGMENAEIQIVSNEAGEPTAVIVPIELWRELESERQTAYLLKSETMKQRLLAAKERQEGLSLEEVVEKLRI